MSDNIYHRRATKIDFNRIEPIQLKGIDGARYLVAELKKLKRGSSDD